MADEAGGVGVVTCFMLGVVVVGVCMLFAVRLIVFSCQKLRK